MEFPALLLSAQYSPLQRNGNGIQPVYLTEVPQVFAEVLTGLIGSEAAALVQGIRSMYSLTKTFLLSPAMTSIHGNTTSRPRSRVTIR
jgi:hypothetical protein